MTYQPAPTAPEAPKSGMSPVKIILIIVGAVGIVFFLIIGLLLAILIPSISRARTMAEETRTIADMRMLQMSIMMYANDYKDTLPPHLAAAVPGYIQPAQLRDRRFGRPALVSTTPPNRDWKTIAADVEAHSDFHYFGDSLKLSDLSDPSTAPILMAKDPTSKGLVMVTFADGHVETLIPSNLKSLIDALNADRIKQKLAPVTPPALPAPAP